MSTTTKNLLAAAATVVFAIAATATTVSSAFAQTSTAPAAKVATSAAQNAAAGAALVAIKAEKPGLTRAQVQAEYFEARKNGTLIETEVDSDVAQTKKHVAR